MCGGYIKVFRQMQDWQHYDDTVLVGLFIKLLLMANYTDGYSHGIEVKRGQIVTTMKSLASQVNMKNEILRYRLNKFVSTNEITIKTTNKYSIITICNYDVYQCTTNESLQTNLQTELQTNYKQNDALNLNNNKERNNNKEIHTEVCIKKDGEPKVSVSAPRSDDKIKLNKKKESAETLNTKLLNMAKQAQESGCETQYHKFILYVNDNFSTLLHLLRLMSEDSFKRIREKYEFEQIVDALQDMDNKAEYIKKKGYTELGLVLQKWIR